MKINEVEQLVGITKKNIRFYEDQNLLHPSRNKENGYRDYTDADIEALYKIKLLRKLSIPIEEIRKIQENHLTLSDCLDRHMIVLSHEEKNLSLMKNMCDEIKAEESSFATLKASMYLSKMQLLEEGGTRFMDIRKNDKAQKKYGTITAAAVMILFMMATIVLLIWASTVDPIPIGILLFFILIPIGVIVGVLLALRQRFKEIEGGEENEASKY